MKTGRGVQNVLNEHRWASNLAAALIDCITFRGGAAVTWYNHASIMRAIDGGIDVARFDYIGLDGLLLRRIAAPGAPRTSADLVLPLLLNSIPGCRVALVGSSRSALAAAAAIIEGYSSAPRVILTCDGYSELPAPKELARRLSEAEAQVVILGLGAPLQDEWALTLRHEGMDGTLLITCGGWIDQVVKPTYYPQFAYRLRLNWLVRVLREPRRLWRRYTIEAVQALRRRKEIRQSLTVRAAQPFARTIQTCVTAPPTDPTETEQA